MATRMPPSDAPLWPAPWPDLGLRRAFFGEERELGTLRRWLESLLPEHPARDDVVLVATELATNAVLHTASGQGGWFEVDITWRSPAVRIAVIDSGAPTGPRLIEDPGSNHGRGLRVRGDVKGRWVWADVLWGDTGPVAHGSPQDSGAAAIYASLARRDAGVPVWFGRATLQWWALVHGGLVPAPSVQELAGLLGRLTGSPPPGSPGGRGTGSEGPGAARACGLRQRHGLLPWPGRCLVPGWNAVGMVVRMAAG
jgi:hypothetical protein